MRPVRRAGFGAESVYTFNRAAVPLTFVATRILKAATEARTPSLRQAALKEEVLALHEQFRQPLFRYLLAFGLSPADVEEVIQETFLALMRHLIDRKPRHNLRAWLFRVAHNQALKQRSRTDGHIAIDNLAEQFDGRLNPEQQLFETQRQTRLEAVVNALSPADHQCLALRVEGLRYRGIAEVLGVSLGSVATSLKRSLAKLAEVYRR